MDTAAVSSIAVSAIQGNVIDPESGKFSNLGFIYLFFFLQYDGEEQH